jgi:hypothetical protein
MSLGNRAHVHTWEDNIKMYFRGINFQIVNYNGSEEGPLFGFCKEVFVDQLYVCQVLWLLTYDDDQSTLTEAVDKYSVGVPPIQWLPWIPQLLTCLVRNEGTLILNLLSQVKLMQLQVEVVTVAVFVVAGV